MEVRTGRAAGHSDLANHLALADHVAQLHVERRAVQERAVEPHAVIDHQQIALERERAGGGEDHHAIGGSDKRRTAGPGRDVEARVVVGRTRRIDPLRPEAPGDATLGRPDEALAPALTAGVERAGGVDLRELTLAAAQKEGIGRSPGLRAEPDVLNIPRARGDREREADFAAQTGPGDQAGSCRRIAVERDEECAVSGKRYRRAVEAERLSPRWSLAARPAALGELAGQHEVCRSLRRCRMRRGSSAAGRDRSGWARQAACVATAHADQHERRTAPDPRCGAGHGWASRRLVAKSGEA